jgi:AraC-like DNA-binding protein
MTMIEQPDDLTGTPPFAGNPSAGLLADVLAQIRFEGALFLRGLYAAPWGLGSPDNADLVQLLAPDAERLLLFHMVRKGRVTINCKDLSVELGPGDLAVLPYADRHIMHSPDAAEIVPIAQVLPPPPWSDIPVCILGGGGEVSEIVCGYFRCDDLLFNSLLRRLPSLFKVSPEGSVAALLSAAIDYALEEGSAHGGVSGMGHLTQMLFAETLKLYATQADAADGWLAASADPIIGRSLRLMHDDPGREWRVEDLARGANTSRSVLGERFRALLGKSPIRYLAEWRMQVAASLLRTTDLKLAEIAERAGYGSEAAFSRAFHRHLGAAPAQWRDGR